MNSFSKYILEWKEKPISCHVSLFGGFAFPSKAASSSGLRWLKIANVGIGQAEWNTVSYLPYEYGQQYDKYLLHEGDIVVALTRPVLGNRLKIALLNNDDTPALLNQRVAKLSFSPDVDKNFIYQYLRTTEFAQKVHLLLLGTDPPNLSTKVLREIKISFPPLEEQRKIAEILGAWDEAITLTERLIEAKQKRKKGLMQQLLTGKVRFAGFEGQWQTVRLRDCILGKPSYGANCPSVDYDANLPRYVRITDIADDGRLKAEKVVSVKLIGNEKYVLKKGDFVFARSGATVGKSYLYNPLDGWSVYAGYLIKVRPNPKILHPKYLEAFTHSSRYWYWVQSTIRAGAQPNINAKEYGSMSILLPSLEEQTKIAQFSTILNEEVILLQQKAAALREQKKGLMQQLLTGKVRVKV